MKLASLKDASPDGVLIVVSCDLKRAVRAEKLAPTMQFAMDQWEIVFPQLEQLYQNLNQGKVKGEFELDFNSLTSPLPRAYQWVDGSSYVHHIELVRKARGAKMPPHFWTDPLLYQGGSDDFLGPCDDIVFYEKDLGIDFEAELAVITGEIKMRSDSKQALSQVRLLMLVNDVSLRNLIPEELAKGFGFYQSKPATSFSPVAVTPDELGESWKEGKVHLPLVTHFNDSLFGQPNAGLDMTFSFAELLSHAARTRNLKPGTILGSGTVSNKDPAMGSSCISEKRMLEVIQEGKAKTSFMTHGDQVRIEMFNSAQQSIFGAIDQKVQIHS